MFFFFFITGAMIFLNFILRRYLFLLYIFMNNASFKVFISTLRESFIDEIISFVFIN